MRSRACVSTLRPPRLVIESRWMATPLELSGTGAGEDNGIDHDKNPLRFPYVTEFSRSHDLHPHP
jgi:hypothetical protein